jgi:hypothetical protein
MLQKKKVIDNKNCPHYLANIYHISNTTLIVFSIVTSDGSRNVAVCHHWTPY